MFGWLFKILWSQNQGRKTGQDFESLKFTVKTGHRYRAEVTLSFFEQLAATNAVIRAQLADVGFKDVKVTGDGGKRLAEGVWAKPNITALLDGHLSNVVEVPVETVAQPPRQTVVRDSRDTAR